MDAEGNPIVEETPEDGGAEPTAEEQLELDLQASIALVAERDATIVEAVAAAEESTAMMEAASATIKQLAAIVSDAVGNISVALNVENSLEEGAGAEAVLAAYTEKSQLFTTQFPSGGVAAVDAAAGENTPAEQPAQSRMDAARSKQTVAPRR